MTGWTPQIEAACVERCAQFGDPACYMLGDQEAEPVKPCHSCLRECGIEPDPVFDPSAAIAPLL